MLSQESNMKGISIPCFELSNDSFEIEPGNPNQDNKKLSSTLILFQTDL